MKTLLASALVVLALPAASAQVSLRIAVPAETPDSAIVYVAGTFNGWNPGAPEYALRESPDGSWGIRLPGSVGGNIEFKFTLGSWENVETDASGSDVANRTFTIPPNGNSTYSGTVAGWRREGHLQARPSTARPTVSEIDTAFEIPQLSRTRRIWLYLPPDYFTGTGKYPVLYMHDGQNLFDAATSFIGEWGVDETLDSLQELGGTGCIVVGIGNGGGHRVDEYSPWANAAYGGGEGDAYLDFVVRTLKPWIDTHYRTLPDRLHTGIAGSSMGGYISLYAGLKFPDVFGRVGVFSPSLWFNRDIVSYGATAGPPEPGTRMFIISGALEGRHDSDAVVYTNFQRRMIGALMNAGYGIGTELDTAIVPDGQHAEWFWRREFPRVYQWLFSDDGHDDVRKPLLEASFRFDAYPNAELSLLNVEPLGEGTCDTCNVAVFDAAGKGVSSKSLSHGKGRLNITGWPSGTYTVRSAGFSRRWVKAR
jgi:predicted alpha/beta superfamily hydrolase